MVQAQEQGSLYGAGSAGRVCANPTTPAPWRQQALAAPVNLILSVPSGSTGNRGQPAPVGATAAVCAKRIILQALCNMGGGSPH